MLACFMVMVLGLWPGAHASQAVPTEGLPLVPGVSDVLSQAEGGGKVQQPIDTPIPEAIPAEAPAEQATEMPAEPPVQTPVELPPEEPTQVPDETPAEVPSQAPTDTPTEAPATPEVTPPHEPTNAHEVPDFTQGYAWVIGGTGVHTRAHDRKSSPEILTLNAGEIVLVAGRTPYVPSRQEEDQPQAPDWFAIRVLDAEGRVVEGLVEGTTLFPLTREETDGLLYDWAFNAPERLESGLTSVVGVYTPPPTPEPDQPEEAEATPQLPMPEAQPEGIGEAPTPEIQPEDMGETLAPEVQPEAVGEPPAPEEQPAGVEQAPLPEAAPEAGGDPASQPSSQLPGQAPDMSLLEHEFGAIGPSVLEQAMVLLDQPLVVAPPAALQDAETTRLDTTPPAILDIQIVQSPQLPGMARVMAQVEDPMPPEDQQAEPTGIASVALVSAANGQQIPMVPLDADGVYALLVYQPGTYHISATDEAGNVTTSDPFDVTLVQQLTEDITSPVFTHVVHEPQDGTWVDEAPLQVQVVDEANPENPTAPVSGIAGVWVKRIQDANGQAVSGPKKRLALDETSGMYTTTLTASGLYLLTAADWAGNEATQQYQVANIRYTDVYPPTVAAIDLTPPKEKAPQIMVEAKVFDAVNDARPNDRVSGLAAVEMAVCVGEDPETKAPILGEERVPLFPGELNDIYTGVVEENGEYAIVATDGAGNQTISVFSVDNVGKLKVPDPNWVPPPKDDDQDGLLTRSEYRLGFNPALRDSNLDGISDGLEALLDLSGKFQNRAPVSLLQGEADPDAVLAPLIEQGALGSPVFDKNPGEIRRNMQKALGNSRTFLTWMDPKQAKMAGVNTNAIMTLTMQQNEELQVDQALSFYTLGMGKTGDYTTRTLYSTPDGSMGLLYDRESHGGLIKQDAYLLDLAQMRAYPVVGTKKALDVALSPDGKQLAIWKADSLTLIDLAKGTVDHCDDQQRCGRIEMLTYLPDGRLITRVTSLGYNAILPDGTTEIGDTLTLPCLVKYQDIHAMTVYDVDARPFRMDFHALVRKAGIYVVSEDPKVSSLKYLSPRQMVEMSR